MRKQGLEISKNHNNNNNNNFSILRSTNVWFKKRLSQKVLRSAF